MKINQTLEGKRVRLIDVDGTAYEGVVGDYIHPQDNEPEGIAGVILDYPIKDDGYKYGNPVQFNENEIKSVEVIS